MIKYLRLENPGKQYMFKAHIVQCSICNYTFAIPTTFPPDKQDKVIAFAETHHACKTNNEVNGKRIKNEKDEKTTSRTI